MANGHSSEEVILRGATGVSLAVGETDTVLTDTFWISPTEAESIRFDVNATAVSGTVTVKLQDSYDESQWFDQKTADISSTGTTTLKLIHAATGDVQYLPLRSRGRLVATTEAGETITVDSVIKSKKS